VEKSFDLFWKVLTLSLIVIILSLQVYASYCPLRRGVDVHTVVLSWGLREIPSGTVASSYVASWKPSDDIKIVAVQIWMGNPSGMLWQGDVYVTLNNQGNFAAPDQVIVHYQYDKHAESSAPHQLWFQLGNAGSGFHVGKDQSVWVWFAFKNISDKMTTSGDGEVIIYYVNE